jgi:hypothetical protein
MGYHIGLMALNYVKSAENAADFLTKPTGKCTLKKSLVLLGML